METSIRSLCSLPTGDAINRCCDRFAMGCPEHYVAPRLAPTAPATARLAGRSPHELARLIENPDCPLDERLAAGCLLSLLGDPRISTFSPAMIDIPGSRALIGTDPADVDDIVIGLAGTGVLKQWIMKECPLHTVLLQPYRIGRYPVTNLEYRDFAADSAFPELPTSWELGFYPSGRDNFPVYTISAAAADAYVAWLSKRTGRKFRLPTESEWEFAAGGPRRLEWPWGERFLQDHANTLECGLHSASSVGAFPSGNSPFGVSDMAGNVEEYVSCDYQPYPGSSPLPPDDIARANGTYRVARGGCFTRHRDLARCRRRHGRYPKPIYSVGFRIAEDL